MVHQPLVFFLLLPLEVPSTSLPLVVKYLQTLFYSNPALWLMLQKQFPFRSHPSSPSDVLQEDFQEEVKHIAERIEEEMVSVIRSWLAEQQPEILHTLNKMSTENCDSIPDHEFISEYPVMLENCEDYDSPTPLQAHIQYLTQEEESDVISEMAIPLPMYQIIMKLRSDLLLHIYYNLYIKMNIIVYSNSVYKLAAIFDTLKMMAKITEVEYYGIPYYTESLLLHHDILLPTAEYSTDTNASFFACVYSSSNAMKK